MPNWKVHLEIGKRLNNYLKYNDSDYNEFLLGNILPDINNSYIVGDIKTKIGHTVTHFDKGDFHHHLSFLSKYQDRLHEPIYLGYYVHLYTDYLFNHEFYQMIKKRKLDYIKKDALKMIKQHDFKVFNNNYLSNTIKLNDLSDIVNKINIDEVNICENDLVNVINYINNTPFYEGNYKFFEKDNLDNILDNAVKVIRNDLDNNIKKRLLK